MLTEIIKYLQNKISALQYLEEVHGLAQIVTQHTAEQPTRFPGVYVKNELVAIDFDNRRTQLFFLLDNDIQRETIENPWVACAYRVMETYTLKAILYKQGKEDVNCHSQSQQIAWNISKALTGKHQRLMDSTGLDFVLMSVLNINLDKQSIWKGLYSLPDSLKDDDLLIEVTFKVETEGDEACFVRYPCPVLTVQGGEDNSIIAGTSGSLIDGL